MKLTDEQVREWHESPVTEALVQATRKQAEARRKAMLQAYWRGEPYSETDRKAVVMVETWLEDVLDLTADDLNDLLEKKGDDEQ